MGWRLDLEKEETRNVQRLERARPTPGQHPTVPQCTCSHGGPSSAAPRSPWGLPPSGPDLGSMEDRPSSRSSRGPHLPLPRRKCLLIGGHACTPAAEVRPSSAGRRQAGEEGATLSKPGGYPAGAQAAWPAGGSPCAQRTGGLEMREADATLEK